MLPAILLNPVVLNALVQAAPAAIKAINQDKSVPVEIPPQALPEATQVATKAVLEQLQADPAFVNATNSEKPWQSRIFWIQLFGLLAGTVGVASGVNFEQYDIEQMANVAIGLCAVGSSIATLVARFRPAGKPLFSKSA